MTRGRAAACRPADAPQPKRRPPDRPLNFDATHIAIRERSFPEVLDLGLQLMRTRGLGLLAALAAGAAPWAVLNHLLIGELVADDFWQRPGEYVVLLTLLMALQAPLATGFITLYLGQVMFAGRVDAGRLVRDYFASLPQMLLLQGVARALTGVLVVTLIMPYVLWPYLSELILLERNPLWVGKKGRQAGRLSTTKRSKNLHQGASGDLFVRWIASMAAGACLLLAVVGGMHQLLSLIGGYDMGNDALLLWLLPIGGWLVLGFLAVVRFLAYLDLRIRREGWEVELKLRAEAAKLQGRPA